jgi:hypothetical protein
MALELWGRSGLVASAVRQLTDYRSNRKQSSLIQVSLLNGASDNPSKGEVG